MKSFTRATRWIAPLVAVAALSVSSASAQEISAAHLEAARAALASVHVTDQFDVILPASAQALKQEMIQKDPNLEAKIVDLVDTKTLELAKRRVDLENEAASAYARTFSEPELREIAAFYTSPTGVKLLEKGGDVTREIMTAAEIWQRGIARDLALGVAEGMGDLAGQPAPDQPAAPAAE